MDPDANWLEAACWDRGSQGLVAAVDGMPYIRVVDAAGMHITNSLLEAHRINSEYIMAGGAKRITRVASDGSPKEMADKDFKKEFTDEIGYRKDAPIDERKFRYGLFKYDINCLIHGVFLEEIGGRLRIPRAISAFIEADHVNRDASGGVKVNIVEPQLKEGLGNVIYHRDEFTAKMITAYFNLDLAQIRGYGLGSDAEHLLIALALFKIQRFLQEGLRLRTACDLEPVDGIVVKRPGGFKLPSLSDLDEELPKLIKSCSKQFADPAVTEVTYKKQKP